MAVDKAGEGRDGAGCAPRLRGAESSVLLLLLALAAAGLVLRLALDVLELVEVALLLPAEAHRQLVQLRRERYLRGRGAAAVSV